MAEADTFIGGQGRIRPLQTDILRNKDASSILETALGSPVPQAEAAMWTTMSPSQRASAIQRLKVLLLFDGSDTAPKVEQAAADTGLSLNRWYEMHREWRASRSLASLGTSAAMPRSRSHSRHDNLLPLAMEVVDADPMASVRQLALRLGKVVGERLDLNPDDRPSYSTLRRFVENGRRRRQRGAAAGKEVVFDCCACTLPHGEGLTVVYLIIDMGTHAVLGAALGTIDASWHGYADAARDALIRIAGKPLADLSWMTKLDRGELVVGLDKNAWNGLGREMTSAGAGTYLHPVDSGRRFGMYVRRLFGDRMGRLKFLPGKTAAGEAWALPTSDDIARLGVEVDAHNATLLVSGDDVERREPPQGLIAMLHHLAEWPSSETKAQ